MAKSAFLSILLSVATSITASPTPGSPAHPIGLEVRTAIDTGLSNIHLIRRGPLKDGVVYTYGSCSAFSSQDSHHFVSSTSPGDVIPDRLLWRVPEDAPPGGCISAWGLNDGSLYGRSLPLDVQAGLKKRNLAKRDLAKRDLGKRDINPIKMDNSSGIDTSGPWFDGVKLLQDKEVPPIVIEELKKKSESPCTNIGYDNEALVPLLNDMLIWRFVEIGILGAGMSGLMTGVSWTLLPLYITY